MAKLVCDMEIRIDNASIVQLIQDQVWEVGSDAKHSVWIEYGTHPHAISKEGEANIRTWARRKLGLKDPELSQFVERVMWKIRHQGGTAHPFFRPAYDKVKVKVPKILAKEGKKGPEMVCKLIVAEAIRNLQTPTADAKGHVHKITDTGKLEQSLDYRRVQ